MLIEKNSFDRKNSKFICDRCKNNITVETRYIVYIQVYKENPRKAWDLCERCYTSLKRGITKGIQNV